LLLSGSNTPADTPAHEDKEQGDRERKKRCPGRLNKA
jgi:hypothetical protein